MKMKIHLLILLAVLAVLAGCQPITAPQTESATHASAEQVVPPEHNLTDGCIEEFDPSVDYFPEKAEIVASDGLRIAYHNSYKVIEVLHPWRDADQTFTYVLVQCGAPIPEGYDDATIIEVPVDRVITMSSTLIPHLVETDRVDNLVGMDSFDYVTSPEVLDRIATGDVAAVGVQADVDVEKVLGAEPDLVLTYGYGDPKYDVQGKLAEVGVPVALLADYTESSPLGRTEWIKFTSAFFNEEARATDLFNERAERYNALLATTANVTERPTVFLNAPRGDSWSMPGGASYNARFLADAGAQYLWADDTSTGTFPLDLESVFATASDADFWLNTGSWKSLQDGLDADPRLAEFAAFAPGRIFNNNLRLNDRGGNDYWERGIANPDEVLADLIAIFHPELMPDHELLYYRALE